MRCNAMNCLFRPTEVDRLLADVSKARVKLGWVPNMKFAELVGSNQRVELRDYLPAQIERTSEEEYLWHVC